MDLEKIAQDLLTEKRSDTDGLIIELDDMGRVLTYKKTDAGGKKPGRPSIWGVEKDGKIQWSISADEADAKGAIITKKQKTTIGSYVTPEEYVLISRYAASKGMTVGAYVRQVVLDSIK